MLTAFGTFWAAGGAGAVWPGNDSSLPVLVVLVLVVSLAAVAVLRAGTPPKGALT
jgi:uncharacterized membrane protein